MKKIFYFALAILSSNAFADHVTTMSELALLPPYCRGTQLIRGISQDPKPLEEYYATYGMSYSHFHHYCWALNTENNAWKTSDSFLRKSKLTYALGDLQYALDRSDSTFVFLPEMYNTKARILFSLKRDAEAVIALNKAIAIKPDYVTSIARLSDYYLTNGDKARAIKTLEVGIDNTEKATTLTKKLKKLGKTYEGTPGNARKKPSTTVVSDPASNTQTKNPDVPVIPGENAPSVPPPIDGGQPANNPYCRFCP